jgi:hypothetical protein
MHSPVSTQALAHLREFGAVARSHDVQHARDDVLGSLSAMPAGDARHASTHLPHLVQASSMLPARS